MRYVAAALLTALGGGEVSEKNLKNLLDAVGIDCDDEKAKIVVEQLKGKSIEELLAEGTFDLTIFDNSIKLIHLIRMSQKCHKLDVSPFY